MKEQRYAMRFPGKRGKHVVAFRRFTDPEYPISAEIIAENRIEKAITFTGREVDEIRKFFPEAFAYKAEQLMRNKRKAGY